MKEKIGIFIYIAFFPLLLTPFSAYGSEYLTDINSAPFFRHLNVESGMISGKVTTIEQSLEGYIWIGTTKGLVRYNGLEFRVYKKDNSLKYRLPSDRINCLFTDSQKTLWVGTDKGLCRYDISSESFIAYRAEDKQGKLTTDNITALAESADSYLLIGTTSGLNTLPLPPKGNYYNHSPYFDSLNSLNSMEIRNLEHSPSGHTFLTDGSGRLYSLKEGRVEPLPVTKTDGRVLTMLPQKKLLWIGTEKGLYSVSLSDNKVHNCFSGKKITTLASGDDGIIWCGTEESGLIKTFHKEGIARRLHTRTHNSAVKHSIDSDSISAIHYDRSGVLWVGHNKGGVSFVEVSSGNNSQEPLIISGESVKSINPVSCIHFDLKGTLWAGTEKGTLSFMSPEKSEYSFKETPVKTEGAVKTIIDSRDGTIWFSSDRGGLYSYTPSEKKLSDYKIKDVVTSICRFEQKSIIAGTADGYLILQNRDEKTLRNKISDKHISSVATDDEGRIWIAENRQICTINSFNNPDKTSVILPSEIRHLLVDYKNRVWCTDSEGKIYNLRLKDSKLSYSKVPAPTLSEVYSITSDPSGTTLISGAEGIVVVGRTGSSDLYSHCRGYSLKSHAATYLSQDSAGNYALGTRKGIIIFNRAIIRKNILPAFTGYIEVATDTEQLIAGGTVTSDTVTLPEGTDSFRLTPSVIHYASPGSNSCFVQLLPVDKRSYSVKNGNSISYTNIKPGNYRLSLTAVNSDGFVSKQKRFFDLVVEEALWENSYFRLSVLVLALLALLFSIIFKRVTVRKKRELIEKKITTDANNLSEISNTLGSLIDDLKHNAFHDHLTGLPDVRNFQDSFKRMWEICMEQETSICLIIIDIDNFSYINKISDYQTGDRIIKGIAEKIRTVIDTDQAFTARYGGDEFALIMPDTSGEEGRKIAEKIGVSLYSIHVPPLITLTVSSGCSALLPRNNLRPAQLLEEVFALLDSAKKNGGNQVCFKDFTTKISIAP